MDAQTLTYIFVAFTFSVYIGIAIWSRAGTTNEFYVAGGGVPPVLNGMATAADWMSAASFISMAGIIAFAGYDASVYLMGWTGGYVILAMLLAPYLRKFGQFTVPDFIGTRYYSSTARVVAVVCLILISFTYVAGQMRGVGIVFSQFLNIPIFWGVIVGMAIVFVYAVLGGMKGITYTQVAQFCVLMFAYLVPAIFISMLVTGIPIPQIGLGAQVLDGSGLSVLEKLDRTLIDLGFGAYTEGSKSTIDVFAITMALMIGTAGLPHVIVRFFTVPKVSDARKSAGYALLFIALIYTTAPAVGAFARINFIDNVHNAEYADIPCVVSKLGRHRPHWLGRQKRRRQNSICTGRALPGQAHIFGPTPGRWFARDYQRSHWQYQRSLCRPRHYGVGEPRNCRAACVGYCLSCSRRVSRGIINSGRAVVGYFNGNIT